MRQASWRGARPFALLALGALAACGGGSGGGIGFPIPGNPPPQSTYNAEVRRTTLGVPHIKAADWASLGYGYGHTQAEDDLCTMADSFLTYRGERSRHFGADALLVSSSTIGQPKNIDSDFFHKHVISDDVVEAMAEAQPEKVRQLVKGFAAGYNRYVREIKAGGSAHEACRTEAWVQEIAPEDIYRRLYSANLAGGYSNFLPNIANATAPAPASPAVARAAARKARQAATRLAALSLPDFQVGGAEGVGSNMYGFGTAATGTDSPLLFGNPHWYWRGPDRFYQAQLTIPGELNVSGTSFLGIPVILIGFNNDIAWSHTVSTARRFGFYQLTLASGDPTSYMRDGQPVKMQAQSLTVDVKQSSGEVTPVTRTLYKSEYGPIVDLSPLNAALGWSPAMAFAIRDINADNYRTFRNWVRWSQARSLDEFIAIQREESAIPWVNTVAVGRGSAQAWYADIGAIPNVSPEQVATCTTPIGQSMAGALPRVPIFDGSRSDCDWLSDPDSAQPGALGPSRMPSLLRDDYVANMNDSYWLSNPKAPLTGYPDIMGPVESTQTFRTRLGHLMALGRLDGGDGYAGDKAGSEVVRQMVLDSRVYTAELFKDQALDLVCAAPQIVVTGDPLTGETFTETVSTGPACGVLQAWDNAGHTTSRGAHLWDEFWARAARVPAAQLYAVSFDAADPVNTPRDLQAGAAAQLQQAFGAAVLRVQASGYALDAARGEYLFATRNGTKIPLYGGCGGPGYFTIACSENRLDQGGYHMDGNPNGNSYMQIVSFPAGGVEAYTFLTFSQSDDPASPHHGDYTQAYSEKQWLRVPFTEAEITGDPALRTVTLQE